MVARRELLAGAAALALSGCGRGSDTSGGRPPERTDTSKAGDVELLQAAHALELGDAAAYAALRGDPYTRFEAIEKEHADRIAAALRDLGAAPDPSAGPVGARTRDPQDIEGNAIAFYLDMLPKVYDARLRSAIASILAVEAEQLAVLRDIAHQSPVPEPFVYGFKA